MVRATKGTTPPKSLQFKMKHPITNNEGSESSSFRVLYYGNASAGSIPFMWESQPGTPKHANTESSLPPLTPPPAYHQFNETYNTSMQQSTSLRTLFLSTSDSSLSYDSSTKESTSLRNLFRASSSRRAHVATVQVGGDSPTSTLCFGGGLMNVYRMKKVKNALMAIGGHGKKQKID